MDNMIIFLLFFSLWFPETFQCHICEYQAVQWSLKVSYHLLGHGSRRHTLMVSGLLSRHRPMVLSLVWHRACLCCVPLPHVTEHWKQRKWTGPRRTVEITTFKTLQRLNSDLHPCLPCFIASGSDVRFQPAYLGPRSNPPLGGTGVSVAGSARLRPVVVAVLVVDDARGVVVQRLNTADRADLHPRFPAGLAAVLPLLCHPAGEQCKRKKKKRRHGTSEDILGLIPSTFTARFHKSITYMGGGQGFWLQSLMSPLGFMLDLLQKLLWTILLSTFLLQPYRRYCFPAAMMVFNKRMHRTKKKSHATCRLFFWTVGCAVPPPQSLEQ